MPTDGHPVPLYQSLPVAHTATPVHSTAQNGNYITVRVVEAGQNGRVLLLIFLAQDSFRISSDPRRTN
ncbi:hypothetical protein VHEMI08019 [[Torrubiella] hemipterigena]|uniref:Uncharacterized protein n=1 Tax=[Torrubiella] hemipterigena TaxID=1531966 RepID=A0A0A1TMQ3_9HYPO|nr:hypothetical protein VHEMI08019 [[Torrubiella] hemipterigena]